MIAKFAYNNLNFPKSLTFKIREISLLIVRLWLLSWLIIANKGKERKNGREKRRVLHGTLQDSVPITTTNAITSIPREGNRLVGRK